MVLGGFACGGSCRYERREDCGHRLWESDQELGLFKGVKFVKFRQLTRRVGLKPLALRGEVWAEDGNVESQVLRLSESADMSTG